MGHGPGDLEAWLRGLVEHEPGSLVDHLLDAKLRALRPRTITGRYQVLRALSRHLEPTGLLEVDEAALRAWWRMLATRGLADSTRSVYAGHVKAFYRWAISEELRLDDPTRRIVPPRRPRTVPRPADPAQLRALLADLDGRQWLPIALAVFAGLRAMEVAAVRPDDLLDADRPALRVRGKGGHERVVPIPAQLATRLRELPPGAPAVLTRTGQPYTAHDMSERICTILRRHGVKATGHQLRHAYGTSVYRANHDLLSAQRLLGHRRPESTAIYAQADQAAVQASAEAAWSTLGLDDKEKS